MGPRKRPAARQPSPPVAESQETGDATSSSHPEKIEKKKSENQSPVPESAVQKPPRKSKQRRTKANQSNQTKEQGCNEENHEEATDRTPTDPAGEAAPATSSAAEAGISSKKRPATQKKPEPGKEQTTKRPRAKAKAKGKAQQNTEPNPFEMPPDPDQQRVSDYFESTSHEQADKQENEHDTGEPAKEDGDTCEKKNSDDESSSSSSSSSTTSHATRVAIPNLGELEEDASELHGSPCMIQPDQVRTRIQMFSFPTRNVQRLKKHWGPSTVDKLEEHLQEATVISLYSGLGGAEVACTLTAHALHSVKQKPGGTVPTKIPLPEFLLACDHNTDCQKILQSHTEACFTA